MKMRWSLLNDTNRVHLGWKGRDIRQGRQKIVGFMKEVYVRISLALSNRQEDARLAPGAQSDTSLKPRPASGLLY
jgi:hypothetical protein